MSDKSPVELVKSIKKDLEALEEILMRDGHLATAGIVRANVITNLMMVELGVNQSYK